MASHLGKRRRIENPGQYVHYPPVGQFVAPPPVYHAPPQPRSIGVDDLWKTVCSLDETYLRTTLFHMLLGNIGQPEIHTQVMQSHDARIREEAEKAAAAVRAEQARLKREKTKVVQFKHHVTQIEKWLNDNSVDQRPQSIVWRVHPKILDRIAKIREKACEPTSTFGTRRNALEALRDIADAIWYYQDMDIGYRILMEFIDEDEGVIESAMLMILDVMSDEERKTMCFGEWNGMGEWWRCLEDLQILEATGFAHREPRRVFARMEEVIRRVSNGSLRLKEVDDTLGEKEEEEVAEPTHGNPPSSVNHNNYGRILEPKVRTKRELFRSEDHTYLQEQLAARPRQSCWDMNS